MKIQTLLALSTCFLLLIFDQGEAKVRAQCTSQHARAQETFQLTVDFVSGGELAKLARQDIFIPTAAYALIWMGGEQPAIVALDGQFFSNPVRANEVRKMTYRGTDLSGVPWQLTPTQFSEEMIQGKALASYSGTAASTAQARPPEPQRGFEDKYPNGQQIHKLGVFYYPNGKATSDVAASYYPNGKNISVQGRFYYPNGQQVESNGQSFYPNGQRFNATTGVDSTKRSYFTESGQKVERPPSYVEYREGDWSYRFPASSSGPIVTEFQASYKTREGTIVFHVSRNEVLDVTLR